MQVLFDYRAYRVEIVARTLCFRMGAEALAPLAWDRLARAGWPQSDIHAVRRLWDHLIAIDFDCVYPGYLCHPLRVAAAMATSSRTPGVEMIKLALCHNFRELSGIAVIGADVARIERDFLQDFSRKALDRLFTDRSRERDAEYLAHYYQCMADYDPMVLILKAMDKLDNHLSYFYDQVEDFHHDVVTTHLIPRLTGIDFRLACYLDGLVWFVKASNRIESMTEPNPEPDR